MKNIENIRKFLKERLQQDTTTLYGYENERNQVIDLLARAANGESNSALLVGPRKCGKTTLVNSAILRLLQRESFVTNTSIISLNGLVHIDDRSALKSITSQMNLNREVEGKVFNSFSENLSFLLSCLKKGAKNQGLIFIIEEFDLFCAHHNQTLLYNLFDVAQSAQTPICVLGLTQRLDVMELLEKRVKSRFSHRQIFLLQENNFNDYLEIFKKLLKLPKPYEFDEWKSQKMSLEFSETNVTKLPFLRRIFDPTSFNFHKNSITEWNKSIKKLCGDEKMVKSLESFFHFDSSIASLKLLMFQFISKLSICNYEKLRSSDLIKLIERVKEDDKVTLITGLSVLEVCLLIAIKHHCDIYDNDPFNFEIIFTRFDKFSVKSTSMQNISRETILRCFENLRHLELIAPVGIEGKVQKEYQMYKSLIFASQIDDAVHKYQNLPTEVEQWAKSSLI
ncbi:CLUMA_CG016393, isoform A [Clunio marinus]|uniref:Origin recognition complex subunit 4 n=1 Tax=Clunio marinus TaxID=568069 RepID=A0A1J1ISJ5_9DIPT|nr:CLUMA_CG016393, isoform A [Clunio marinus]